MNSDVEQRAPVRVAVMGVGSMGRNHVRVLGQMPGVDLVAVSDSDPATLEGVARTHRGRSYVDYHAMLEEADLDAVVISLPTSMHEEAAGSVIDAGIPFLIEKPLGATVEAARRIADRASERGVMATVGHIERYNPAVISLRERLDRGELGRVFQLRAIRTGPLPPRIQDVGVIVDLATHELDVCRWLAGSAVSRVFAETARRINSEHEDLSTALLRFEDGTIALLDVNWLTPVKVRELTVVGERGMFRLDYLRQDLFFYENSHVAPLDMGGRPGVSEGNMTRYHLDRAEPLRIELEAFVEAITGGEQRLVPLADGVAAVELAEAVRLSAETNRATVPGA